MAITNRAALALLSRTFRSLPLRDRVHVLGRFASCPFLRVLPHVPVGATLLDVGAGHGAFAALAVAHGAGRVVAIDPDLRKVCLGAHCVPVPWIAGFDAAVAGSFDVVTMFDVLYRVPLEERDALFSRLFDRLRPGGRILIKELDPTRRAKFAWNRTQEWISDRILRLTLGEAFAYEPPAGVKDRLLRCGFEDFADERIDAWYPHSHVLYSARRGT